MNAPFALDDRITVVLFAGMGSGCDGLELVANLGTDCSGLQGEWHGVAPAVEIVTVYFHEARSRRAPKDDLRPETQTTQAIASSEWRGDLFQEAAE